MPRIEITVTPATGNYPTTGQVVTMTAADTTNFEQFSLTGKEVIIVQNSGASGYTYTITSTPDAQGRSGDITTAAIAAGAIHTIGPLGLSGWAQTNGKLYIQASNVAVKWGIIRLP